MPTIKRVLAWNAMSVVLMSHCGRPDGRPAPQHSLLPCVPIIERLIGRPVTFLNDCVGPEIEKACANPTPGSVFLLENLRFHPEEEGVGRDATGAKVVPSPEAVAAFRTGLSSLGDVYVNDAFGTAHRAHSSMVGCVVEKRVAGLLMKKEISYFGAVLEAPKRPVLAILGGAKVKDKIKLIENLYSKVDMMIIGGGMVFTFMKVIYGMEIGKSLYDEEGAKTAKALVDAAKTHNVELSMPSDFLFADKFDKSAQTKVFSRSEAPPPDWIGVDCGPKSLQEAQALIARANTIIWNGPQGVFEIEPFAKGSLGFVEAVGNATARGAVTVVGGGDTASLVLNANAGDRFSHISTGGGASLELLEGKELPGVVALSTR